MKKIIHAIITAIMSFMVFPYKLNLQAFAYDPTAQPANWTGSPTLPDQLQKFLDKNLIRLATPNLIHDEDGQERDIPANNGTTINFRAYAALPPADEPLVEGVTPDGKTLNQSHVEATVRQYGDYIVKTDMLDLVGFDNNSAEALQLLGNQSGLTLDRVTRNAMQSGTNVFYAPKISGGSETEVLYRYDLDNSAKLTVDLCEMIHAQLKADNVPTFEDGTYHAIVHPYALYDLRRDPDWIKAADYAKPEELLTGEVGKIAGIRFKASSEAKIYNGADLCAAARNLTVSSVASKVVTVSQTLVADALVGREVIIHGVHNKITANTTNTITLEDTPTGAAQNDNVYPGEGGAGGIAVFGTLVYGKNAYGKTKITNGGLQTIVQPATDPLHQRNSVGWKGTKAAVILVDSYLIRVEHCSKYSTGKLKAN